MLAVVLQRASGHAPSIAKLAGAFDTAYWWSLGIGVLSLIPCLVLLRAENPRAPLGRAAANAEAAASSRSARSLGVGGSDERRHRHQRPQRRPSARRAARAREWSDELVELGAAFRRVFRTSVGCAGATRTSADPSSATPSSSC